MSSNTPPNPYFNGINFNSRFFIGAISAYLTEAIANTKYLLLSGANFMTGNLGIGISPGTNKLQIRGTTPATLRIETGTNDINQVSQIAFGIPNFTNAGCPKISSITDNGNVANLQFSTTTNGVSASTIRMTIKGDGNVGIGTTIPNSLLHLHNTGNNQEVKLLLTDNSTGTGVTDGTAIMKTDQNDLFLINYESTRMFFLTANITRLAILANGNIAVGGNTNPGNIFQVGDGGRLRISNGISDFTQIGTEDGVYTTTNAKIFMSGNSYSGAGNNGGIQYFATGAGSHFFYTTNTPMPRLQITNGGDVLVGGAAGTTRNIQLGTGAVFNNLAISASGASFSSSASTGDMILRASQKILIQSGSGASALTINTNNNVGIANAAPGNIFMVGSGARLKIANDANDFTMIGTNDTDGTQNTRIVLAGFSKPAAFPTKGDIEYISTTTTGVHKFFTNGANENLRIAQDDFQIKTSCSTYGFNYYTDGEFIPNETRTNASGTARNGYFVSCQYFYNSLVNIAVSHNDITYNYWAGHVYCNNFTQPITITTISSANCIFEYFAEQTTGAYFLFFRPTGTFNASTQLRVKFYG